MIKPLKMWWFLGFTALSLGAAPPAAAWDGEDTPRAVYLVVILVLLLSSLAAGWQMRGWTALRYAAVWVGIGLALIALYAFRPELKFVYDRIAGAVLPSTPTAAGEGAFAVRMADDGHFHVQARLNGRSVEMLADTGASTVVLPKSMAGQFGIDVGALRFTTPFETANGRVLGAMTRIDLLEVGGIVRRNVVASVVPDLGKPLLGMSFFNTLSAYSVEGETLTMRD
jgi:aspartyl protease family protein